MTPQWQRALVVNGRLAGQRLWVLGPPEAKRVLNDHWTGATRAYDPPLRAIRVHATSRNGLAVYVPLSRVELLPEFTDDPGDPVVMP